MEDIDRDRFMTPAEAVAYGLVDAVLPPPGAAAGSSIAAWSHEGVHHLGVAVADLDEAVATYDAAVRRHARAPRLVPDQGVEAASVLVGESRIELLAPTADDTPVGRFLAKRGPGMHHVAYEVDDVAAALAELAAAGAQLIDEQPAARASSACRLPLSIPTPSTASSRRWLPWPNRVRPYRGRLRRAARSSPPTSRRRAPTRSSTRSRPARRARSSSTPTTAASDRRSPRRRT